MSEIRLKINRISAYVYIILVFLAVLFYGNIFWVFPKVIRYKKGIVRLAICAGWFTMVFGANYFIVGPLFDQANPMPPMPPCYFHCKTETLNTGRYLGGPTPGSSSRSSLRCHQLHDQ